MILNANPDLLEELQVRTLSLILVANSDHHFKNLASFDTWLRNLASSALAPVPVAVVESLEWKSNTAVAYFKGWLFRCMEAQGLRISFGQVAFEEWDFVDLGLLW